MTIPLRTLVGRAGLLLLVTGALACRQRLWPDPPAVNPSQYEAEYAMWRAERQAVAIEAVRLLGVWAIPEGDTAFGTNPALPLVLRSADAPATIGTFHRAGDRISIVPARGVPLLWADGTPLEGPSEFASDLALGSMRFHVETMREADSSRRFVTAWDEERPAAASIPPVRTYPVASVWRVAARFDAFRPSRRIRIGNVRGGSMDAVAAGRFVFRLGDRELQLTAITNALDDELLVMFADETNQTTTYGGYRNLWTSPVGDGEWTALDFNLASNPPCAYSPYTLCPLPPPENRLPVAIEAGEQRYPRVTTAN